MNEMTTNEAIQLVGNYYIATGSPLLNFALVVLGIFLAIWAVFFVVGVVKRLVYRVTYDEEKWFNDRQARVNREEDEWNGSH